MSTCLLSWRCAFKPPHLLATPFVNFDRTKNRNVSPTNFPRGAHRSQNCPRYLWKTRKSKVKVT